MNKLCKDYSKIFLDVKIMCCPFAVTRSGSREHDFVRVHLKLKHQEKFH